MDRKAGKLTLREVTAFALLVLLLAGGLLTGWYMGRQHDSISRELDDSVWLALSGQWDKARKTAEGAREKWEKNWHLRAAFGDHTPMEEIDDLFEEMKVYAAAGERTEFARVCGALSVRMEAMANAQKLSWWNVL